MKKHVPPFAVAMAAMMIAATGAQAHGPLFSPAPRTIWKGGRELTLRLGDIKASGAGTAQKTREIALKAMYGITADWAVGIEIPYVRKNFSGRNADGMGDLVLDTKYRFWKRDAPGAQYKAAAFLRAKLPTGADDSKPRIGSGSTDVTAGLTTGYESRRWYWFASGAYRANTEDGGGLKMGDKQFLNVVGGIRPVLSQYKEPDTVLMLELNWERANRHKLNGIDLADTGGWQLFVSPVLWWTYRQLAVRGGVQVPVAKSLNGTQPSSDYRGRLEVVYHF